MYNSIILTSCLFGSVYLFSQSLLLLNWSYLENKKIANKLILINGLTMVFSGSMFLYIVLTN